MDLVKEVMKDLSSWKDGSRCVHKKGDGVLSVVKVVKKRRKREEDSDASESSSGTHMRHCSGSKRKYTCN